MACQGENCMFFGLVAGIWAFCDRFCQSAFSQEAKSNDFTFGVEVESFVIFENHFCGFFEKTTEIGGGDFEREGDCY